MDTKNLIRISQKQARKLGFNKKEVKSKYGNKKKTVNGFTFDSIKEANRYQELLLLQQAVDSPIEYFLFQVPFRLEPKITYWADFLIKWKDGRVTVEDTKGVRTQVYKIKKKLMATHYPTVEIEEI